MDKELHVKIISVCILIALIPVVILGKENLFTSSVFGEEKKINIDEKVMELTELNSDFELIAKRNYNDKFLYLAFQSGDIVTSYILDINTGEEKKFEDYLKSDKKEAFDTKIKELLYLKYPTFIADVLANNERDKTVQLCDNELIIHYSNEGIEPTINEKLFLRVNYNEVKDYLDFSIKLDSDYENENGYVYDKKKKTIAFTFDDGPNGVTTNKIVELLGQNKAHATFFMVGNRMSGCEAVIRNVLAKGNEIGSHSYAHKNLVRQKISDVISGEEKTNEIYKSITGQDLIYLRPPYGNVNKELKENLNTIFINWSLDTEDWLHRDKRRIVDYVMETVQDGDIILMHDLYDSTVDAVSELLPKLYAEGYQVVNVSELASLKGKTLETHSLYRRLKEV